MGNLSQGADGTAVIVWDARVAMRIETAAEELEAFWRLREG